MKTNPNNLKDIDDDQERIFYQLNTIWDKKTNDIQTISKQLIELKILQSILISLILLAIIFFFILILNNIHFIIVIIDITVLIFYIAYIKYIGKKTFKNTNLTEEQKEFIINFKRKDINSLKWYLVLFLLIVLVFISLLIFSLNSFIFILLIFLPLLFIYFDNDIEHSNSPKN